MESARSRILADRRRWGEKPPSVPYTASGMPPPQSASHFTPITGRAEETTCSATLSAQDREGSGLVNQTRGERHLANDGLQPNSDSTRTVDALLATDLDTTITMMSSQVMISTNGWSLDDLLGRGKNFQAVRRVPAASSQLPEVLKEHERKGIPLVVDGFHKHKKWPKEMFSMKYFEENSASKDINVRNVHNWSDKTIPLREFVTTSRSAGPFAKENETERLYGKDAECPKRWEEWLSSGRVVPPDVISQGTGDLFRFRPDSAPIETLMCYLGVGDTFTPCHKDICASSGQNLMCYTEHGGSSFWFMTEGPIASKASQYFHQLGQELDHENHIITVEELAKAPFKVYILEQKLGDLVLVPPRSCHQVVNYGGITIKTSWSRMTLKGLETAYYHELPIYRRVCRYETYRIKSTIYYVLMAKQQELEELLKRTKIPEPAPSTRKRKYKADEASTPSAAAANSYGMDSLASELKALLSLYHSILIEEFDEGHRDMSTLDKSDSFNDDARIVCDFCGCDVFQSFFECEQCVDSDSSEGNGYTVCPGCYSEGRSCRCRVMTPKQCRSFELLLDAGVEAVKILDLYAKRQGESFESTLELSGSKTNVPQLFRAACQLLTSRQNVSHLKPSKVCTTRRVPDNHIVPFSGALYCRLCHFTRCFNHILGAFRKHSAQALLVHASDNTHTKYHEYHKGGTTTFENDRRALERHQEEGTRPDGFSLLVYNAISYQHCKPAKTRFMELGWYDASAQTHETSEEEETSESSLSSDPAYSPRKAALPTGNPTAGPSSSTSIPHIALTKQQVDNSEIANIESNMKASTLKKRKMQVYIDVPPAPYRIPGSRHSTGKVVAAGKSTQPVSSPSKKSKKTADNSPTTTEVPTASTSSSSPRKVRLKKTVIRLGEYGLPEGSEAADHPGERILIAKSGLRVRLSAPRKEGKPIPADVNMKRKASTESPEPPRKNKLAGLRFNKVPLGDPERSPSSSSTSGTIAATEDTGPLEVNPLPVDYRQQVWRGNPPSPGYHRPGPMLPPHPTFHYSNPPLPQERYYYQPTAGPPNSHMKGFLSNVLTTLGNTMLDAAVSNPLYEGSGEGSHIGRQQRTQHNFDSGNRAAAGVAGQLSSGQPGHIPYATAYYPGGPQFPVNTVPIIHHFDLTQRRYVSISIPESFPQAPPEWGMMLSGIPGPIPPPFAGAPASTGPHFEPLPFSEGRPPSSGSSFRQPYDAHHQRSPYRAKRRPRPVDYRDDHSPGPQKPHAVVPWFDKMDHSDAAGQEFREVIITELAPYQNGDPHFNSSASLPHRSQLFTQGNSSSGTAAASTQLPSMIISTGKQKRPSLSLTPAPSSMRQGSPIPEPMKTPTDNLPVIAEPEIWELDYEMSDEPSESHPVFMAPRPPADRKARTSVNDDDRMSISEVSLGDE